MEESKDYDDDYFPEEDMNLNKEYEDLKYFANMMGRKEPLPDLADLLLDVDKNEENQKKWRSTYKELSRLFHPDKNKPLEYDPNLYTQLFQFLNNFNKKMQYYYEVMKGGKRRRTKQRKTRRTRRTRKTRRAKKTRRYY
jgi:hypothetical protein